MPAWFFPGLLVLCAAPAAPAARASPAPPRDAPASSSRALRGGVYPVYDFAGRWLLLAREERGRARLHRGDKFLVVGSQAASLFSVVRSSGVYGAACRARQPARTRGYLLSGPGRERVGNPIIAIAVPSARKVDPKRARFKRLESQVDDTLYAGLGDALRGAALEDIRSGDFRIDEVDAYGRLLAQDPKPDKLQSKIDFGASIRLGGADDAFMLVEGTQFSKTYRRCLRLFLGDRPAGGCAEMPHALLAETNLLDFVTYDPNGTGAPFLLAYTAREPLWGHERWGFRLTRKGPARFLMDALDPKCRDRF